MNEISVCKLLAYICTTTKVENGRTGKLPLGFPGEFGEEHSQTQGNNVLSFVFGLTIAQHTPNTFSLLFGIGQPQPSGHIMLFLLQFCHIYL